MAAPNYGTNHMKTMTLREAQADLASAVDAAQHDRVILERDGKPCAIIVGLDNHDAEDFAWASSSEFWEMIESRRTAGSSSPLAEVRARLLNE